MLQDIETRDDVERLVRAFYEHAMADAVHRWAEAGASSVILQPTPDDPDPEGFVRFVAERVRPLVTR